MRRLSVPAPTSVLTPVLAPVLTLALVLSTALAFVPGPARASDHADPITLENVEAGLTGLFFWPEGDQMIVALGTRRSLTAGGPYNLQPFAFTVNMDLHTQVTYDDPADLARYGGTVVHPEGIHPDIVIRMRLNDDASVKEMKVTGLPHPENIRVFTGPRDDPFIFPRFFGSNVIAMVFSIPMSEFPPNQQDWLLWGTSSWADSGKQIDHVGRSNRTQNARNDFLNTLPPNEHVAALQEMSKKRKRTEKMLMQVSLPLANLFHLQVMLYPYDLTDPDVMIYTNRRPPGYPNGRMLPDDVAYDTCQVGDCTLMALSYAESTQFPRATVNDKPFLDHFPYLAEPWPEKTGPPPGEHAYPLWLTLGILVLIVSGIPFLVGWFLGRWREKRLRAVA